MNPALAKFLIWVAIRGLKAMYFYFDSLTAEERKLAYEKWQQQIKDMPMHSDDGMEGE